MPFKNDQQRKAVFAKMSQPRINISTIPKPDKKESDEDSEDED